MLRNDFYAHACVGATTAEVEVLAPSKLRSRRPAHWQRSSEAINRPPADRVSAVLYGFALDTTPFKRRRESNASFSFAITRAISRS